MDKRELQQKLNQPYTTENWKEVVQFVFPNVQILNPAMNIPIENDKVESFKQIGNVKLQDGKNLAMFELKLKPNVNILRNRVELNNLVSKYIDQEQTHGVLSIFEQGTDDYRFTFSARASEFDEEESDFKTTKTDTKRFTYVLGRNESCKTPAQRFFELSEKKQTADIKAIEEAFSVEKLSKLFFKEYKEQYERFVNYLMQTPGLYTTVFKKDDKKIRDFVKILLGRIVFIKFVQKKGWMGVPSDSAKWENGDYRFIENAFASFEHKDLFYSGFLEPLFFEALNQAHRPNDIFPITGNRVPFLSGGLFENEEKKTKNINFPKSYFENLFEFLDRYNFTIDENDSNDHEVGIDPEMLGHIFENLLEDNKDKGAFYTPKEIVRYMCQESLKEYLKTSLENNNQWPAVEEKAKKLEEALHNFVTKKEAGGIIDFDKTLATALKDVKICDPAIGSGAFPMGLLNEIFHLVHRLYEASPDKVGPVWKMNSWQPNIVKQNIIQNSIYGVDIEKGAVDIARLRFWLSLIVDEPEPKALPHLDYKIVVGNSLVSKLDDLIIDIDWGIKRGAGTAEEFVNKLKKLITTLSLKQKAFFESDSDDGLKEEIRVLKIDILINQLLYNREQYADKHKMKIDMGFGLKPAEIKANLEIALKLKEFDNTIAKLKKLKAQPEAPLHFFDWKLDFPEVMNENVTERVGFDIVIGNPPYIDSETMVANMPLDREYIKNSFNTAKGNWDLFVVFIERGINICNKFGYFTYIIPNKLLSAKYTIDLREFISKKTILEIRDYSRVNVFKEADVYPVTINILNKSTKLPVKMTIMSDEVSVKTYRHIDNGIFHKDLFWDKFFCNENILQLILKLSNFKTLNSIKSVTILGAATVSEAYLVKDKLTNKEKITDDYKKLINTGTIDKWVSLWGIKNTQYIKDSYIFPVISNDNIDSINTTRLLQANQSKIIIAGMSNKIEAFLDVRAEYLAGKSTTIILDDNDDVDNLKFITGILNSELISFYVNANYHSLKMAGGYLNINNDILNHLPIPTSNNKLKLKIIENLNLIISRKEEGIHNDITDLEQKNNNLIYKLYDLTYEEVLVVEPEFSERMSKEAYEQLKIE